MRISWAGRFWRRFSSEEIVWVSDIDVLEKEDSFVVKVELPGVKEEDVNVSAPATR